MQRPIRRAQAPEQLATFGCIVRLTRRQRERYGRARVCGEKVDLGVPSAAGLADSLRTVFFRAPVPSGCTLTLVLSNDTASILIVSSQ